jgi:hypothetical protein
LVEAALVESRGQKNEIFRVTHEGFEAADVFRAEVTSISED